MPQINYIQNDGKNWLLSTDKVFIKSSPTVIEEDNSSLWSNASLFDRCNIMKGFVPSGFNPYEGDVTAVKMQSGRWMCYVITKRNRASGMNDIDDIEGVCIGYKENLTEYIQTYITN